MNVSLLGTDCRVLPSLPVELLVDVDGRMVRASIERKVLAHLMGATPSDEDSVHRFIRRNRRELELAVKASLYSHGVPLDRHLVLGEQDLRSIRTT
ncbi:MAG: hypothetical protein K2Y35_19290 [Burkholderiales bacterium]|nr:hypothetical protein [Burkholderiales bacterium]